MDKEKAKKLMATSESQKTPIQGNKIAKRQLDRKEDPGKMQQCKLSQANPTSYFAERYLT